MKRLIHIFTVVFVLTSCTSAAMATSIRRATAIVRSAGLSVASKNEIMQEVFMVEKSIRYDIKGKKYIDTPAKYYFADLGLRNARINFRQHEVTHLMENLIYNELRIRGLKADVSNWRLILYATKAVNDVTYNQH